MTRASITLTLTKISSSKLSELCLIQPNRKHHFVYLPALGLNLGDYRSYQFLPRRASSRFRSDASLMWLGLSTFNRSDSKMTKQSCVSCESACLLQAYLCDNSGPWLSHCPCASASACPKSIHSLLRPIQHAKWLVGFDSVFAQLKFSCCSQLFPIFGEIY